MDGEILGKGVIPIEADLSAYDKAMDALPGKAQKKIAATMQALQAEMARTRLEIKTAENSSDPALRGAQLQRLAGVQDNIQAKMDAVTKATIAQATEFQRLGQVAREAGIKQKEAQEAAARAAKATTTQYALMGTQMASIGSKSVVASAGLQQAGNSGRNAGFAILEMSRAIEDAQYGLSGVLNNIPGIVMAMGGSGGIAGAISIVAVGANLLYTNWSKVEALWKGEEVVKQETRLKDLKKAMDEANRSIKDLEVDRMKELGKATLDAVDAMKKLRESRGQYLDDAKSKINDVIQQVGGNTAFRDIANALHKDAPFHPRSAEDRAKGLITNIQMGRADAIELFEELFGGLGVGSSSATGRAFGSHGIDPGGMTESQRALAAKEKRDAEQEEQAANLDKNIGGRFDAEITHGIMTGLGTNLGDLADRVGEALKQAGVDAAPEMSFKVASAIADRVKEELQKKALAAGITPQQAAQQQIEAIQQNLNRAEREKKLAEFELDKLNARPSAMGRVSDYDTFQRQATEASLNKTSNDRALVEAQLKNTDRTIELTKQIEELNKQISRGAAMLGGMVPRWR